MILIVRGHINSKTEKYAPLWPQRIFESDLAELYAGSGRGLACRRRNLQICVAWTEPTSAGSSGENVTYPSSTSKRSPRHSGFPFLNSSGESERFPCSGPQWFFLSVPDTRSRDRIVSSQVVCPSRPRLAAFVLFRACCEPNLQRNLQRIGVPQSRCASGV